MFFTQPPKKDNKIIDSSIHNSGHKSKDDNSNSDNIHNIEETIEYIKSCCSHFNSTRFRQYPSNNDRTQNRVIYCSSHVGNLIIQIVPLSAKQIFDYCKHGQYMHENCVPPIHEQMALQECIEQINSSPNSRQDIYRQKLVDYLYSLKQGIQKS